MDSNMSLFLISVPVLTSKKSCKSCFTHLQTSFKLSSWILPSTSWTNFYILPQNYKKFQLKPYLYLLCVLLIRFSFVVETLVQKCQKYLVLPLKPYYSFLNFLFYSVNLCLMIHSSSIGLSNTTSRVSNFELNTTYPSI